MYYSFLEQDSGDIIQFIKKRVLKNNTASAKEINDELNFFLGSTELYKRNTETLSKKTPLSKPKIFTINGEISSNISKHKKYLQDFRKIGEETLNSAPFKNILFSYTTETLSTLAFYLNSINGEIKGINRIQTEKNDYFNKKWFEKDSDNSNSFTFSNKPKITETLSVFESLFDAMSYFELYQQDNMQFIISNGELSFNKARLITTYFSESSFEKLLLCNDNDLAGILFNLNIIGNIIPNVSNIRKGKNYIKMDIVSAGDKRMKVLLQFFKRLNRDLNVEEQATDYFIQENEKEQLILFVKNKKESVSFLISLLLQIFNLENQIEIKNPTAKDFNEDLIHKKRGNG